MSSLSRELAVAKTDSGHLSSSLTPFQERKQFSHRNVKTNQMRVLELHLRQGVKKTDTFSGNAMSEPRDPLPPDQGRRPGDEDQEQTGKLPIHGPVWLGHVRPMVLARSSMQAWSGVGKLYTAAWMGAALFDKRMICIEMLILARYVLWCSRVRRKANIGRLARFYGLFFKSLP